MTRGSGGGTRERGDTDAWAAFPAVCLCLPRGGEGVAAEASESTLLLWLVKSWSPTLPRVQLCRWPAVGSGEMADSNRGWWGWAASPQTTWEP